MTRDEFLEEAGHTIFTLGELVLGMTDIFSGHDGVVLRAEMNIMRTKIQLLQNVLERKILEEQIVPTEQQLIPLKL